jgi:hypothetical protein
VPVIRDLDEFEPAFFDGELDARRAGVERVFEEFFDCCRGPQDDLDVSYCLAYSHLS